MWKDDYVRLEEEIEELNQSLVFWTKRGNDNHKDCVDAMCRMAKMQEEMEQGRSMLMQTEDINIKKILELEAEIAELATLKAQQMEQLDRTKLSCNLRDYDINTLMQQYKDGDIPNSNPVIDAIVEKVMQFSTDKKESVSEEALAEIINYNAMKIGSRKTAKLILARFSLPSKKEQVCSQCNDYLSEEDKARFSLPSREPAMSRRKELYNKILDWQEAIEKKGGTVDAHQSDRHDLIDAILKPDTSGATDET